MTLFDELRKPHGHTARGCFNCKHHNEQTTCVKNMNRSSLSSDRCIAYYTHHAAEMNRVNLAHFNYSRENWQKEWEWNGQL